MIIDFGLVLVQCLFVVVVDDGILESFWPENKSKLEINQ